MGCAPADLVYGQALRVPGEFFDVAENDVNRTDFAKDLHRIFNELRPAKTQHHAKEKIFVSKRLNDCTHVFVRFDAVKKPLQRPYDGPYLVLQKHDKFMDVDIKGKSQRISIDRLKPAYIADEVDVGSQQPSKTLVTPSGHRVRFLV